MDCPGVAEEGAGFVESEESSRFSAALQLFLEYAVWHARHLPRVFPQPLHACRRYATRLGLVFTWDLRPRLMDSVAFGDCVP
jgi:hypothetical protein